MGEIESINFRPNFNHSLRVETRPYRLTAHAGVVLLREIDDLFGISTGLASRVQDPRQPKLIVHPMVELIRTRLYLMALGRRDQDDADQLRHDPALRLAVSDRRGLSPLKAPAADENLPEGLPSQPTLSRLLVALAPEENQKAISDTLFDSTIKHFRALENPHADDLTLDTDSFSIEAFGQQPGSAYNGYYKCQCFHPIVTFLANTGDMIGIKLRPGNVHTANGVHDHLFSIIDRLEREIGRVACVRGDAGFPEEILLHGLEKRGKKYTFRIKSNNNLERLAADWIKVFQQNPQELAIYEMDYKAQEWSRLRRVVLVVKHRADELFPDYFFIVTNWEKHEKPGQEILEFYRQRGTAEGFIGEFKSVIEPAISSTNRSKAHYAGKPIEQRAKPRDAVAANEVTLLLFALAYNLANVARRVSSQPEVEQGEPRWSLARLQERVLQIAARLAVSGRRVTLVISDVFQDHWRRALAGLEALKAKMLNSS